MGKHKRPEDAGTAFDDQYHASKRRAEAKAPTADQRISSLKRVVGQHRQDQTDRNNAARAEGERQKQPRKDR